MASRFQELFGSDNSSDEDDLDVPLDIAAQEPDEEEEAGEIETQKIPPVLPFPLDSKVAFLKMINVLNFKTRPFDPDTFEEEEEEEEEEGEREGEGIKVQKANAIRWRYSKDNNDEIESNARFVRWSDGTMQLHVGKEVFDVDEQDTARQNFHLFVRGHGTMRSQGRLDRKLRIRPSAQSKRSHKLRNAIAEKAIKERKIKIVATRMNPEEEKRQQEEKERRRIADQQRKRRRKSRGYSSQGVTSDFLEDDDEDDETSFSLASARRRRRTNDWDDEEQRERRISNAKNRRGTVSTAMSGEDSDSESEEEEIEAEAGEDEDEEEEEESGVYRRRARVTRAVDDDSDD